MNSAPSHFSVTGANSKKWSYSKSVERFAKRASEPLHHSASSPGCDHRLGIEWFLAYSKVSLWCPTVIIGSLIFVPLFEPRFPLLISLWFVGIQLVWQQTNQVQEEYRQVSGRSQSLRCKDSRDSCTRSGRSRAEQPDQLAHHAKFWCVRALTPYSAQAALCHEPLSHRPGNKSHTGDTVDL